MSRVKDTWFGDLDSRWRIYRRRGYHFDEGAEDDGRVVNDNVQPVTATELLDRLYADIRRMVEEANERRRLDEEKQMMDETLHPDAPHANPEWRRRSRVVWYRMRRELHLENAPWHHREIYSWAASTAAGVDWLEREIGYWEARVMVIEERKKRWAASAKRRALTGEPVSNDEIFWGS